MKYTMHKLSLVNEVLLFMKSLLWSQQSYSAQQDTSCALENFSLCVEKKCIMKWETALSLTELTSVGIFVEKRLYY